jgi:hypothetical protein
MWRAICEQYNPLEGFETQCVTGAKMNVKLKIEEMPGYLKTAFNGASTTAEVERQFELLAKKCKSTNKNRLLLDFRGITADISLMERYELGRRTLVFAQYKCKVAAVCNPDQNDSHYFLGTVAQNRWVDLRVFTNVDDAVKWLLE